VCCNNFKFCFNHDVLVHLCVHIIFAWSIVNVCTTFSGFLVCLRALDYPPTCGFDVGVYSICCELHIDDLILLPLGVRFTVVRDVGCTLGFQFVLVLSFVCCDHDITVKYVCFYVSLSVELLAFRRRCFF
jgi:hypothetical protein